MDTRSRFMTWERKMFTNDVNNDEGKRVVSATGGISRRHKYPFSREYRVSPQRKQGNVVDFVTGTRRPNGEKHREEDFINAKPD